MKDNGWTDIGTGLTSHGVLITFQKKQKPSDDMMIRGEAKYPDGRTCGSMLEIFDCFIYDEIELARIIEDHKAMITAEINSILKEREKK